MNVVRGKMTLVDLVRISSVLPVMTRISSLLWREISYLATPKSTGKSGYRRFISSARQIMETERFCDTKTDLEENLNYFSIGDVVGM